MVIESSKHRTSSYVTMTDQEDPQTSSENGADSPLSSDERATATAPSPKKSRRSIQKRVVQVPIAEVEGSRSKPEAYPPSDSWAWRKYGQKPIKGSPYPRNVTIGIDDEHRWYGTMEMSSILYNPWGYYRCSSSKGCPARKQVERSRVDPTMLLITYASEHNHPLPTSKHHHHHHKTAATVAPSPSTPTVATPSTPITTENSNDNVVDQQVSLTRVDSFGDPPHLEFVGDTLMLGNSGIEYSWISDFKFSTPALMGPKFDDNEVSTFSIREEDESLFGDLDELPECSTVFRRIQGSAEICSHVAPLCEST